MNTQEDKTDVPGDKLSRIYRTDPFGFPLYPADEEIYARSLQEKEKEAEPVGDTDASPATPEEE